MSEEHVKKEAITIEMDRDDEYEMELGQQRENSFEIDKSKYTTFFIKNFDFWWGQF